jgi:hypothetical protein
MFTFPRGKPIVKYDNLRAHGFKEHEAVESRLVGSGGPRAQNLVGGRLLTLVGFLKLEIFNRVFRI